MGPGSAGSGAGEEPPSSAAGRAAPEPPTLPQCDLAQRGLSERELRRLTTPEVVLSLRAVFGAAVDASAVAQRVPSLPVEQTVTAERGFDNRITDVEALEALASALAHHVLTDADAARAVLDCDVQTELTRCRETLLDRVLRRLFRRPLSASERESYEVFIDDIGGVDGLEWALVRAIVSPHFHQHLELTSEDAGDGRLRIDAFAAASRLAFALTSTLPDELLLDAAEQGELDTLEGLREQGERLLQSDAARDRVRTLLLDWLEISPPDPAPAVAASLGIDREGLGGEARDELLRFVDYVVFERRGSFRDLWTDPSVFPFTDRLAALFGVTRDDGPVEGRGAARGLFLRPASLLTSAEHTSPIVRGANTRRALLCELFPTPDPALVAAGNAVRDKLPVTEYSGRERAEAATEGAFCASCHARINALGFVLESFGPAGEYREEQRVVDEDGATLASFAVDSSAADAMIDTIGPLASSLELAPAMAQSPTAMRCFTERIFASSRLRASGELDGCLMRELIEAAPERPALDIVLAAIVNDDIFYRAEVTP
jgi:Protein of unknown function (DUF1592)/Protein of unknown function (DUF1588)